MMLVSCRARVRVGFKGLGVTGDGSGKNGCHPLSGIGIR